MYQYPVGIEYVFVIGWAVVTPTGSQRRIARTDLLGKT